MSLWHEKSKLLFTSVLGNPCVSPLSCFQGLGAASPLGGVCVFLGHYPGWEGQVPGTAPEAVAWTHLPRDTQRKVALGAVGQIIPEGNGTDLVENKGQ